LKILKITFIVGLRKNVPKLKTLATFWLHEPWIPHVDELVCREYAPHNTYGVHMLINLLINTPVLNYLSMLTFDHNVTICLIQKNGANIQNIKLYLKYYLWWWSKSQEKNDICIVFLTKMNGQMSWSKVNSDNK
jgi:hypothetical protein